MVDLTPVGLSKDGSKLVLISARGDEYTVVVDSRLRAALQGDRNRLGQLEMTMESTLRPRDIQARIRAGETAEDVAAAAHTTVDKIVGFAGPVLAERAHVAESAQASSIRRRSGDPSAARVLAESADPQLRALGVRPDDVVWDAWRREDGRWTVVADFQADGRPRRAEFTYDLPGRYVVADNDEARVLTGEAAPPAPPDVSRTARRLSPVPASQDQLPLGDDLGDHLGDDAIELVRDHGDADWIAPEGTTRRTSGPIGHERDRPAGDPGLDTAGDEAPVDGAAPVPEPTAARSTSEDTDDAGDVDAADGAGDAGVEPEESTVEIARRGRRKGRASVPSWDEIMFGGGTGKPE